MGLNVFVDSCPWAVGTLLFLVSTFTSCNLTKEGTDSSATEIVAPNQQVAVSKGNQTIMPGEILNVYVLNDDSFTGRYQVLQGGEIVLRKVGRVQVGGMSIVGAEAAVKQSLSGQLANAKVVVARSFSDSGSPGSTSQIEVFLSGKVSKPGKMNIPYDGGPLPTVHQTILQAGGFTRFAHKKKVHILRKGGDGKLIRIPTDIMAIENGEVVDVALAGGDIIVVPEKTFGVGP
jgi:protein involved in polysaccharide export with SLBB domain